MPSFKLDIVTAERVVYSADVDEVVVPGAEGQLGILPHHTPLMTTLAPGELVMRKGSQETSLAVSGAKRSVCDVVIFCSFDGVLEEFDGITPITKL